MGSMIQGLDGGSDVRTAYAYTHQRPADGRVESIAIDDRATLEHAINLRATLILNGVVYAPTGQVAIAE